MSSTRRSVGSRHTRLRAPALVMAAVFSALISGVVAGAPPALAAAETVTVNLASTSGTAAGVGAGFLYGLSQDAAAPNPGLLASLDPTSDRGGGARLSGDGWIGDGYTAGAGFNARMTMSIDQARQTALLPSHPTYDLLVSDLYGADTTQPSGTAYPCAGGNCSNWITFIDTVVGDVQAAGVSVRYDIWNEPDNGSFWAPGYGGTQYFAMWNAAVDEIRRLVPSATIVGPSVSNYNTSYLSTFLTGAKSAGTLPNVLNWHFSGTPVADAQTTNNLVSSMGISPIPLSMNEYLNSGAQNAGQEAWNLTQIAKSGLSSASHAIWSNCCNVPSLDGTLVQNSAGTYVPTGQWWVYKDYGDVTGSLAAVTNGGGTTDAVAGVDQARGRATILLGDNAGNTGAVSLAVNGLSSTPWLFSSSGMQLTVQRIPDQNPLAQPIVVSSQIVASGTGSLTVPINWVTANDAYFVTMTPFTTGTATIDGAATSAAPNYFQYGSNWGETTGVSDMYDGTANWSFTPGSTAVLHFTGNQVALHAVKDVDQGEIDISVDGSAPVTVDDYAATRNASGVVWTSPVLDPGTHIVVITVDSTKNPASSGTNIALDRADISSGTRIDANATTGTHFAYSSGWGETSGISDMYAGTANWNPTAGSTATMSFTGTKIALHAVKDVDQGIMTVSIDGAAPTSVDDYASTRLASGVVWTSPTLASGTHTLTVTVTGTHDSSSSGSTIALDSVDILP
jgi:hypothetical protein